MNLGSKPCEYCGAEMAMKISRDLERKHFCSQRCRQLGRIARGEDWTRIEKAQQSRILKDRELPAFNTLLGNYQKHAKDRNLSWGLTREEFKNLTKSDCWYTGRKPSNVWKGSGGSEYIYNGIDRIDNELGYTLSNCVPCCSEVNYAKRGLSLSQFLTMIREIGERHVPLS